MFFHVPFTSPNKFIFMIAEVIRKEQKSSNSDAERAIKRWFKEATDRKGGRKLRAEKKID